jgi:hypothetical protein
MTINKHHNHEYSGGIPEAVGDRYYSQDLGRDFWYLLDKAGKILDDITNQVPIVLEGGVVSKGTGDTINITAGRGYAGYQVTLPDDFGVAQPPTTINQDIEAIRIQWVAVNNLPVTYAVLDGVTVNYVKLRYLDLDLNDRDRAKKAGSYYYEKTPNYVIDVDTTVPTKYNICLATFTGTPGGSFTFSPYLAHRERLSIRPKRLGISNTYLKDWDESRAIAGIGGNAAISGFYNQGTGGILELTQNMYSGGNPQSWRYISSDYATMYQQYQGEHIFYTVVSGIEDNIASISEKLKISNDGILKFPSAVQTRKVSLYEVADNNFQISGFGYESGAVIYNADATTTDHIFFAGVNSTTRQELLRITGDKYMVTNAGDTGNLITGGLKLYQVAGGSVFTGAAHLMCEGVAPVIALQGQTGAYIYFAGNTTSMNMYYEDSSDTLYFRDGSTIRFRITPTETITSVNAYWGNMMYAGSVVYNNTLGPADRVPLYMRNASPWDIGTAVSSLRYKTDIADMEDCDWLYNLRPVNFAMKKKVDGVYINESDGSFNYGLIAEEVDSVNSLFVIKNQIGESETVRYEELISPMIKIIQDQKTKIDDLESRIQTLEGA